MSVRNGHEAGSHERLLTGSPFHSIGLPDSGYSSPTLSAALQPRNTTPIQRQRQAPSGSSAMQSCKVAKLQSCKVH